MEIFSVGVRLKTFLLIKEYLPSVLVIKKLDNYSRSISPTKRKTRLRSIISPPYLRETKCFVNLDLQSETVNKMIN